MKAIASGNYLRSNQVLTVSSQHYHSYHVIRRSVISFTQSILLLVPSVVSWKKGLQEDSIPRSYFYISNTLYVTETLRLFSPGRVGQVRSGFSSSKGS